MGADAFSPERGDEICRLPAGIFINESMLRHTDELMEQDSKEGS